MKTRNLTCIVCPRGCPLTAELDDNNAVIRVSGNSCPRGEAYAADECTAPKRSLTSTMRTAGGEIIPVKTKGSIPKEKMLEAMREINKTIAPEKIEIGQVLIENVCGTRIDIVATYCK